MFHAPLALSVLLCADAFNVALNKGSIANQGLTRPKLEIQSTRSALVRRPLQVQASSVSDDASARPVPAIPTEKLVNIAQTIVGAGVTFGLERCVAMALRHAGIKIPSAPVGKAIFIAPSERSKGICMLFLACFDIGTGPLKRAGMLLVFFAMTVIRTCSVETSERVLEFFAPSREFFK